MADFEKLNRRNTMGEPPKKEQASSNLDAPEIAPSEIPTSSTGAKQTSQRNKEPPRIDGRSIRKTFRLIPFATRVSPYYDRKIREVAKEDHLLIVEVLEKSFELYLAARLKNDVGKKPPAVIEMPGERRSGRPKRN